MTEKEIVYDLIESLDAFYLMIRSVATLGTKSSERYNRDGTAIIYFIGKAFGWEQEKIERATNLILGKMMRVGLTADYLALGSANLLEEFNEETLLLFELKGRAIEEVTGAELSAPTFAQNVESEVKNRMGYGSFHHEYEPRIRFFQIKKLSENGNATAMLEHAIMLILGIGCQKDILSAQRLLQNLLIWGEKSTAKILSFLWGRENNNELKAFYEDVFELLDENGFPKEYSRKDYKKQAKDYVVLVSAVKSLIVRNGGKEVDTLFADLMNREDLEQGEKIELIRRYKDGFWLNKWIQYKEKPKVGFLNQ